MMRRAVQSIVLCVVAVFLCATPIFAHGTGVPSPLSINEETIHHTHAGKTWRVLFLNLNINCWPWALSMFSTCHEELQKLTGQQVEMIIEKPSIEELQSEEGRKSFRRLFKKKYKGKIDYIVAWGQVDEPMKICRDFPEVPIIRPSHYLAKGKLPTGPGDNVYIVSPVLSPKNIVHAALSSRPETKNIVIITGLSALGRLLKIISTAIP